MSITVKSIEKQTEKAMKGENRAYCVHRETNYTIKESRKNHDAIVTGILKLTQRKPINVLDIGCGFGDLVYAFARKGINATGTDIDKHFISVCKRRKTLEGKLSTSFSVAPAEKLPFKDKTFDLVVSKTVLEHVKDVNQSIREMTRVVKDEGTVYLECPNYFWIEEGHYEVFMLPLMPKILFRPYLRLRGKNPNFINHIQYTTPGRIRRVFEKEGFVVENHSEKLIEDIALGKVHVSTHPFAAKVIRAIGKMGLAKVLRFIARVFPLYPVILITAHAKPTKKRVNRSK